MPKVVPPPKTLWLLYAGDVADGNQLIQHCPGAPLRPLSVAVYRRSLPDGISTPIDVGVDNLRHIAPAIHTAALKTPRLNMVRPGASVGMRIAHHAR
jgi:hypothetical protein